MHYLKRISFWARVLTGVSGNTKEPAGNAASTACAGSQWIDGGRSQPLFFRSMIIQALVVLGLFLNWTVCSGEYKEGVDAKPKATKSETITLSTDESISGLPIQRHPEMPSQESTEPKRASIKQNSIAEPEQGRDGVFAKELIAAHEKDTADDSLKVLTDPDQGPVTDFEILDSSVKSGQLSQLHWNAGQSFSGRSIDTPVLVVHGARSGPVLCLTAAVHGDELNGVEIVRRIVTETDPQKLAGTLIGVPIVNLLGLARGSRYLPDRRDLNRYFPGYANGSAASRIAYLFFEQVIRRCHYLVDFHTGSAKRSNLPQLRADLNNPAVKSFTKHFGTTSVLHHSGSQGMLRWAASTNGIPAVTFELGEPSTLQLKHVEYGVQAIDMLMQKMKMIERFRLWSEPQPVYYASRWVRADRGGIMITATELGARVVANELLGWVIDPITNDKTEIRSPESGRILGMALNQFVLAGFAAFHIGIEAEITESPIDSMETGAPGVQLQAELMPEIENELPHSDIDRDDNRFYD